MPFLLVIKNLSFLGWPPLRVQCNPRGAVPKWLREGSAKPSFGGSIPPGASSFSA